MATVNGRARRLLVRMEMDEDFVRVSVRDSGIGFNPEVADKLFDPFFTTKQEGMRIGLSVSRSIIDAHHGILRASRNEGSDSTFSFSIPCASGSHTDLER
jgi:signal transduction histidine kinase